MDFPITDVMSARGGSHLNPTDLQVQAQTEATALHESDEADSR